MSRYRDFITMEQAELMLEDLGWKREPYRQWSGKTIETWINPRGGGYTLKEACDRALSKYTVTGLFVREL